MILTVAWRNIWRNKRRTLITAASIFFAIFFALIMRSIQIGTFGKMTEDAVTSYTGHIQIHKNGFWEKRIINNVFERDEVLEAKIKSHKTVDFIVPKIESFALASVGARTKGCMVTGIDPEKENEMVNIKSKITSGKFFTEQNDKGAILGDKLAGFLNLKVNDTLVMIGQGYHAISAAGKYPIRAIVHFPSPELNRNLVYITLPEAQEFYSTGDRLTSLSVLLKNNKDITEIKDYISQISGDKDYEIMDWSELLIELKQLIDSKKASTYVMLGILYMIVGFGVFGTVVMMTAERWREFGLLTAIGMNKLKLRLTVFIETIFIGFIGIAAGFIVSLPLLYKIKTNPIVLTGEAAKTYEEMGFEPILTTSLNPDFMITQILIVGIIILIAVSYPIFKLRKLKPATAMYK